MAAEAGPATTHNRSWSAVDLSELDDALAVDKEALYTSQRLAVDTVEVSRQQLWALHRQQQQVDRDGRWCRSGRSILGLPVLHEGCRFTSLWLKLMMVIDLSYTTFYIPFTLAMYERYELYTTEAKVLFSIDAITGAFFAANLLLQLHMPVRVGAGFYQLLVSNGLGIARIYRRKGTFWIDLATALPWSMQLVAPFIQPTDAQGVLATMMVLRLLRLVRVVHLVKCLARGELAPHSSKRFLSVGSWYLLSLMFSAIAIINLLACAWYASTRRMGEPRWSIGDTWLSSVGGRDLTDASKLEKYLASVYFTVTTITTTGYGDITAKNNVEMVLAIVIMLAGALFMSVIIGTVAALLNSSSPDAHRSQAFRNKVTFLDRYFHKHQTISKSVECQVYHYYYYVWTRCLQEQQEWQEVVCQLPTGLRGRLVAAVLRQSCGNLMEQLGKGVPEAVLITLCGALERHVVSPGQNLAAAGSPVNCMWLLRHGSVMALKADVLVCDALSSLLCEDASMSTEQQPPIRRTRYRTTASGQAASSSRTVAAAGAGRPKDQQQQQQRTAGSTQQAAVDDALHDEEAAVAPDSAAGSSWNHTPPLPQQHLSKCITQRHAADYSISAAAAATAAASASVEEVQQQLEQQGLFHKVVGPCMFPDYALISVMVPGRQQGQPADDAEEGVSSNGSSNGSGGGSGRSSIVAGADRHPVWLRTEGLCVLYQVDVTLVGALCEVCPQLGDNLKRLLKQVKQ